MSRTTKTPELVGSICLYGGPTCGAGYLAHLGKLTDCGKLFGNGEPSPRRSMTDALWLACLDLKEAGAVGNVSVHIDTAAGPKMAIVDVDRPQYFGALTWLPNVLVYEIAYEDLVAAAEAV